MWAVTERNISDLGGWTLPIYWDSAVQEMLEVQLMLLHIRRSQSKWFDNLVRKPPEGSVFGKSNVHLGRGPRGQSQHMVKSLHLGWLGNTLG